MFMKIVTRISIALAAVTLLGVGFSVITGTTEHTEISTAMVEERPVIVTEPTPSLEDHLWGGKSEMVKILVEEAKNESDDPFEGLTDEDLQCVFTTMLEEFDFADLVAISNGSANYTDRLVSVEEAWKSVCGLGWFVDSFSERQFTA